MLAPPGRGASGRFAAESGARILAGYEAYYGLPYPLPKLDLIAVGEHAFGAMENWGAISFNESRLLLPPGSASFDRRDVFETISHEVAHQWFGNLVTMRWWDDVWLNESFAAFLETKVTDRLDPSLDAPTDFVLRTAGMAAALEGDSLRSTHPVRVPVERPEEISQIFDEISYGKGSSVLRMLEAYLGDEPFRLGVRSYLERYGYANARTEDLWEALERTTGTTIGPMVGPWIDRPGLPVVRARRAAAGVELDQRRYSFEGTTDEPPWPIPLVYDTPRGRDRLLFAERKRAIETPDGPVHLNPGGVGFYRTLYDPPLLDGLLKALPDRPPADRWIVLNDLAAFVVSGEADWTTYARAVERLGASGDRLVVEEIVRTLTAWALAFPEATDLQERTRTYLAATFDRLGPEARPGENPADGILRERVAFDRVRLDEGFARALGERFVAWDRLDPDLKGAAAVGRARSEGDRGHREIRRALDRRPPEGDALRLARALPWSADPSLVEETLEWTLTPTFNRGHLVPVVVQAAANPFGRPLVLPWIERRLSDLDEACRGSALLSLLLERALPLAALGRAEEARRFFAEHPAPEGARGLAKALERVALLERLRPRLLG